MRGKAEKRFLKLTHGIQRVKERTGNYPCTMILETPGVIPVLQDVPGIQAFFTTRTGGVSGGLFASLNLSYLSGDDPDKVRRNWDSLLHAQNLSEKSLALPRLCHGNRLAEISGAGNSFPENTDAVYTLDENRVLAVTLGDCLAILIADPLTRCVAAVHAGWRGTRENILGRALDSLFAAGLCLPESTWLSFGPCLSTPALEISPEIAKTLPSPHVHTTDEREGKRFFFDLRGCNQSQAEAAGVTAARMSHVRACTRTDAGRFFSYRRDGAASGRMAACIALK